MKRLFILVLALVLIPLALAAETIPVLKATAEAAVKAANAAPNDYAANWKAAMALRKYGSELVSQKAEGWKDIAKVAAKDGMKYGEIAQKLNPNGVEGWYWYGVCVGTYSDCVSILTALGEGLKSKTQKGFEMAYTTNKGYENGDPIISLGRFWQVLPGIAGRDVKKAEALFTEYITTFGAGKTPNKDAWYYRGLLYKEAGKTPEAKADLKKAADMGNKDAAAALAELK